MFINGSSAYYLLKVKMILIFNYTDSNSDIDIYLILANG